MNKKLTVYLAGACKHLEDEGTEWRQNVANKLQQVAEWKECNITIIDPTKYFSYSEQKHKTHKQVMDYYYWKIRNSDIVLVNLDKSDTSCGSCMEAQYAADHDIPIIGFGTSEIYDWLAVLCQVQFNNSTEAIDYIRDYYMD